MKQKMKWLVSLGMLIAALAVLLPTFRSYADGIYVEMGLVVDVDTFKSGDTKMTGTVLTYDLDYNEFPIEGAWVSFTCKGKQYSATTNAKGRFSINGLPYLDIGKNIKVSCEKRGYMSGKTSVQVQSRGALVVDAKSIWYGAAKATGKVYIRTESGKNKAVAGAKVYFKYKGKTYTTKTTSGGRYTFKKLPLIKHGAVVYVYATRKGYTKGKGAFQSQVKEQISVIHYNYAFSDSTVQKGNVQNVHRGDVLKITIGKKVYKKTFKKNASKVGFKIPVEKAAAGTKVRYQLISKYGMKWVDGKDVIYGYKQIRRGDTRQHVMLTPTFRYPLRKTVSEDGEVWWYENNNYIYFDRSGKVRLWSFTE